MIDWAMVDLLTPTGLPELETMAKGFPGVPMQVEVEIEAGYEMGFDLDLDEREEAGRMCGDRLVSWRRNCSECLSESSVASEGEGEGHLLTIDVSCFIRTRLPCASIHLGHSSIAPFHHGSFSRFDLGLILPTIVPPSFPVRTRSLHPIDGFFPRDRRVSLDDESSDPSDD
jgi:hypothetical protein